MVNCWYVTVAALCSRQGEAPELVPVALSFINFSSESLLAFSAINGTSGGEDQPRTKGIRRDINGRLVAFNAFVPEVNQHTNRPCLSLSLSERVHYLGPSVAPKRHMIYEFSGKWGDARFSPVQSSRSLNRGSWKNYVN